MTYPHIDAATRIMDMVENKRREARGRERNSAHPRMNRYYEGRTDMAAEILREIQAGNY